jgi:hypothetical protein
MVRIKDDGGTYTKCLLDPFDEEALRGIQVIKLPTI